MNLGVDPRHADQMVRGVVLAAERHRPHGCASRCSPAAPRRKRPRRPVPTSSAPRICVEMVQGGTIDFDRCIATPDMMPLVGRLGKVLGPRGLMPNPKVGTVTMDVATAVKGAKGGAVEFRVEKAGIIHAGIGKASFDDRQLVAEHQGVRRRRAEGAAGGRQGHVRPACRGFVDHGPRRPCRSVDARRRRRRLRASARATGRQGGQRRELPPPSDSCPRLQAPGGRLNRSPA